MPYRTRVGRPSVSSQDNHTSSTISSNPDDNEAFYPELKPLPRTHAPLATNDPSLAIPFDMSILTISHKRDMSSVKAVIVGGGITGLAIAIMMELGGMEYEILERSTGSEPEIGAAVALGPPVLRLLEQMGLLPQIEKASKIVTGLTVVDGECQRVGRVDGVDAERYAYPYRVLTRKIFHDILMERVNKNHLHQGKLVIETLQNPNGVSCKCSDGSTYYGDIIIGADGAHSLTREKMYVQLREQGKLPEVDMDYSIYEHVAIGGVTDPLDHNLYPSIKSDSAEFQVIYTKDYPCTLWYMPVGGSRVAWYISNSSAPKIKHHPYSHSQGHSMSSPTSPECSHPTLTTRAVSASASTAAGMVLLTSTSPIVSMSTSSSTASVTTAHHTTSVLSSSSSSTTSTTSSGPRSSTTPPLSRSSSHQSRINHDWYIGTSIDFESQFKDLLDKRCALGVGSVRDFMKYTPKKSISAVDLEERLYKTWHHGRIVLVGDACHQHLVIGGQGAMQGLLDGVCLVNLLYDMEHSTPHEITKAFKKYHSKRSPVAKSTIEETTILDKMFHGQGFKAGLMRRFMFSTVWSFNLKNDKLNNNRPQLSFLPFVEDRGLSKANRQKVSGRLTRKTFAI
ncbi:hypothetical protein MVEG_10896 [Podila verticillata NRRL 6337]|nr:MAG: hypothetical protein BYD32DRAFT_412867 [Podila humilis]KFH63487.1 hypothetical protein MVEG_10896 [Podila verticillata NRRL 6337]